MKIELLSCPFCGGNAEFYKDTSGNLCIRHLPDKSVICPARYDQFCDTEALGALWWNTRVQKVSGGPMTRNFMHIKVGDKVTRLICGLIPHELEVTEVDEKLIHCDCWTFDRVTGREIDKVIGFNNQITGSFLSLFKEPNGA